MVSVTMLGCLVLAWPFFALADGQAETAASSSGDTTPELVIGVPKYWPPHFELDAKGRPIGFAIELFEEIAKRAGYTYRYKTYKTFPSSLTGLQKGEIDVLPNVGIIPSRMDYAEFTVPIETFAISIFVRHDTDDVSSLDDLAGRKVAVVERNVGVRILKDHPEIKPVVSNSLQEAIFNLVAGGADALIYPQSVAQRMINEVGIEDKIKVVGKPLREVKRGMAVLKGRTQLLDRLNAAATGFVGTPAYQKIYVKWFAHPKSYWTSAKVATLLAIAIVLSVAGSIVWRQISLTRVNRDLKRSEADLANAQRIAHFGHYRRNLATGELYWSDEFYRIFGFDKEKVEPTFENFFAAVHPDDKARVGAVIKESQQKGTDFEIEFAIVRPDGAVRHIYSRNEMCPDARGDNVTMQGTHYDITERKQAVEKIRKLNAELEQRVEERTAELKSAQDELLRSERLATLGQLTGTVAHELRNPLNAVTASLGVIEHRVNEAGLDLDRSLARTRRGIQRCENIITELLDFARARGLELEPTPIDSWLSVLLSEVTIPEGVSLTTAFDAPRVAPSVDRDRFRRALINIVDNACDAMTDETNGVDGTSKGELRLSTRVLDHRLEIEISDTGPGIPAEMITKVFEPLFSTKTFGVGLGLPTVRQIMDEHGGGFSLTNGDAGGATALLWLPLAEVN
jgi:PAS domain S-box-containing protein